MNIISIEEIEDIPYDQMSEIDEIIDEFGSIIY